MNAIATPSADPRPGHQPKANPFGTDAVYKGYDLMVRKCATHIIRLPHVTMTTRADLVRAIGSPAVSFAASAADGSVLLACPDGLPDTLRDIAEPLTPDHDPLGDRLATLERKLDRLIDDQQAGEQMADRLAGLEFTLRESLDTSAETAALAHISSQIDAVLHAVALIPQLDNTPVLDALHQMTTTMAALPQTAALDDLHSQLTLLTPIRQHIQRLEERSDQALSSIATLLERPLPLTNLYSIEASLTAITGDLDLIRQTTLAGPDFGALTAQHDALLHALGQPAQHQALTGLARQLDHLTGLVTQLGEPAQRADLASDFATVAHTLADLTAAQATVLQLASQFDTLRAAIGEPAQGSALAGAAAHLTDLIRTLAERPQPDPTAQLDSLTGLVVQLGEPAQRTETAADLAAVAQTLANLTAAQATAPQLATHFDTLMMTLGQPAQGAAMAEAVAHLTDLIRSLAERSQPDLTGQLDALTGLVAQLGEPAQRTDLAADLAAMSQTLGDLVAGQSIAPRLAAQLDTVLMTLGQPAQGIAMAEAATRLADLILSMAKRPEPDLTPIATALIAGLDAVADRLDAGQESLSSGLDTMLTAIGQPAQAPHLVQGLDALATRMDRIDLAPLAAQVDAGFAALGQPAQAPQMIQALGDIATHVNRLDLTPLAAQVDAGFANLGQPAQAPQLSQSLDDLAARMDRLDLATLTRQVDAGFAALGQPAQHTATVTALVDLTEQVLVMAERPDPVIDMTAQRQSFARFGTALGNAVQRLEAVAGSMSPPDLAPILGRFDSLRADMPFADSKIAHAIEDLTRRIETLACALPVAVASQSALLGGLKAALIAALPADPGAAIDAGFAALSTQLSDLANRQLDPRPADPVLTNAVLRLEYAALKLAAPSPPSPDLAALASQIAALDSASVAHGHDLSQQLAILIARPDTSADIAAQKQHLGDFAKGLADLVQWLEPLTRDLTMGPDFGPILSAFDLLRGDLDLRRQDAALDRAMADLSGQIADLAKSPDGFVSLAEQRQSFASVSNALSYILQRLDGMVTGGSGPAAGPVMGQATGDPALQDIVATLSGLVLRLEFLLDKGATALLNAAADRSLPDPTVSDPVPTDSGQMIHHLASATRALADLVDAAEGADDDAAPGLASAACAPLAELFDRLDRALAIPSAGESRDAAITDAMVRLAQTLHGTNLVGPTFVPSLRGHFAELVAHALQVQTEAA